jgi:hypothetical protein
MKHKKDGDNVPSSNYLRPATVLKMNKKSCVEWCKKRENHNKMTQKARKQKEKIIFCC